MELKFVIPNMAKSLGNLEFGGPAEVKRGDTRRNGTQTKVLYRRYKLFSDVQRADDIEVVIDGAACLLYTSCNAGPQVRRRRHRSLPYRAWG